MRLNQYHFITHWRVESTCEEVSAVLGGDAPALSRWWPAVYLDVKVLEPGDAHGLGQVIDLYTKGWLPYTLRWKFRVTEVRHPHGLTLQASGDFDGRGIWTFVQDGPWVDITYDWKIRANKPLLRYLTPVLRPIFAANHEWAMRQGLQSLKLELSRRRAASEQEAAQIPPPPPPTTTNPVPLTLAMVAFAGGGTGLIYMLTRKGRKK